ncbi:MAG TPA: translation initiation factor IF-2 [Bacteroidota bacterium]|nr:translation initiation factor IF-2 [Bacteroidota bacterium]
MTEKGQTKKKIYQLAKELNISHETLMQYLKKKGHIVKSHMSVVDDAMLHDIMSHFKKDKEVAEKHHRKIQTIRDTKKKTELAATLSEDEPTKVKVSPKQKVDEVVEVTQPTSIPFMPGISIGSPTPIRTDGIQIEAQIEVKEKVGSEEKAPDADQILDKTSDVSVVAKSQTETVKLPEKKSPEIFSRKIPKMGLTIKGKINLDEVNRTAATVEGAPPPDAPQTISVEEQQKKKKKKKRIRTKSQATSVDETDDLLRKATKKKKLKFREVDKEEVEEAIRRTLAEIDETSTILQRANFKRKRREKRLIEEQRQIEQKEKDKTIIRATEFVSVNELANMLGVNVADVIKKCIDLGIMVSINQRLERDTITLVADEFGFEVNFVSELSDDIHADEPEDESRLEPRSPVVTIMGHVDHGKTSLLDYIRQSNVVAGEAGGITQHIGAYSVSIDGKRNITFLDTPGHEAFTAMRARGTQLTDIVVLVVAADENVMPQTIEAISHAQAANVPIIIALNKCDKPDANPDRIRQQLAEKNILVEEWGGKYQCVEISARMGKNVDLLLEKILLEADILDLKADPHTIGKGIIIEAQVDRGKGIVATILVQKGMMKVGDCFVAGIQSGKIRAMFDERSHRIEVAKPSTPTQLTGFDGVPQAGDPFLVVENERVAREISVRRQQLKREQDFRLLRSVKLDDISKKIREGEIKELKVIVKGDVDGSVGALADSLMKIVHEEVRINVIHRAVGGISESDVLLAAASNAIIIGFHVRPNLNARRLAEQQNVDIHLYDIIYDAIEDVRKALEGLLAPEKSEEITATIEVRDIFKIPKVGTIAGCYVQDGKIARGNKIRLIRDGIVIYEGTMASLKRFKEDVREVESGFECGIGLESFNDLKVGDTLEAYKIIETTRKLS